MASYSYQGKNAGKPVSGQIEATSEAAAAEALMKKQIMPLSISLEKKSSSDGGQSLANIELFVPNVTLADLVMFSRQMYSLVKAGIPIMRAINGLADTTTSVKLSRTLQLVNADLEKGKPLSNAIAAHPKVFSRLFISMVSVGENTGNLDAAFLQLSYYYEQEQETRKRIQSALRYPIMVLVAIAGAIFAMNIWVIPTFAQMFKKFGSDLPTMTKILISSSNFFVNYWYVVIAVIFGGLFAARQYIKTESGAVKWDKYKLKIPAVGSIIERSTLSRFSRSFSMMLSAGVPLTQALNLVSEAVDNAYMSQQVLKMRRGIEKGDSLLRTANASHLFTPLVLQMISVGEETGSIDQMLTEVADFYEREVDFDLKSLTAKIEPILISIVAGMVLILALGIFMPMWNMMNVIKG
ncbi:type II secretion system F family protein [Catenovulum maritimum]|uniref:MSHA biogenesis protein MshG n=1 Tax=Catenovulum maritimum TaxID=1513271 RepID=A0A0J8JN55_9ALTE|nr:type II secretion system F family protein [Catenovulum maritimum]KMT66031.1 MSHA biogenesis protein MshG [Catenovulum maritimum]